MEEKIEQLKKIYDHHMELYNKNIKVGMDITGNFHRGIANGISMAIEIFEN